MFLPKNSNCCISIRLSWILLIALIVNEKERVVFGRTWPRMKSYGKIYVKDTQFTANSTTATTIPTAARVTTGERSRSLSETNDESSSPPLLHSQRDYNSLNGNVSSRCINSRHHQHEQEEKNGRDNITGGDAAWWTNDKNCMAGPFQLEMEVANRSLRSQLCPSPDGKFPIGGACGWYVVCSGSGHKFTLNKCEENGQVFDTLKASCLKASTTCNEDLDKDMDKMTMNEILERIVQFIVHFSGLKPSRLESDPESTQVADESRVDNVLQSLDQDDPLPSTTPLSSQSLTLSSPGQIKGQLEDLCKTSTPHGLHAHPKLCSKYIQCGSSPSSYFLKSCGPGTVFNSELSICDWPVNVPQCTLSKDESGSELYTRKEGGNENNNQLQKRSASFSVEANDKKDSMTRKKRDIGGNNKCSIDSSSDSPIRPDPLHCNKYHVCSNGRLVSITCGRGTLFNPLSMVCDHADNVDCSNRRADFATYGCDHGDFYRAPHPEFCNKFVECDKGTLAIKSCPPGTLYQRDESKCDHAYKVSCRKPISLAHDIDKRGFPTHFLRNSRQSRNNNNKLNLACDFNYIAPHPNFCNQFVECENKRIFIKTCGPGTAYNPEIGKCDWPYNVKEPDQGDCTKYRECGGGNVYQTKSCQLNQIYDANKKRCVPATSNQIQQCRRPDYFATPRPT